MDEDEFDSDFRLLYTHFVALFGALFQVFSEYINDILKISGKRLSSGWVALLIALFVYFVYFAWKWFCYKPNH